MDLSKPPTSGEPTKWDRMLVLRDIFSYLASEESLLLL